MKPSGSIRKTIFNIFIYLFFLGFSAARDAITFGTPLRDGETLVSDGKTFELGFFSPEKSNNGGRFLGIWYYSDFNISSTVWIANRDHPVLGRNGALSVDQKGNLQLLDKYGKSYWSRNIDQTSTVNVSVQLMDSGNLVLKNSMNITWQSFDSPTDTFLPGMTMNDEQTLTSWKGPNDPGTGNFTFKRDKDATGQFTIRNGLIGYWKSDVSGKFIPSDSISLLNADQSSQDCFSSLSKTACLNSSNFGPRRLVMTYSGEIKYMLRMSQDWTVLWSAPKDMCSVFNVCGKFGICNINNGLRYCKCLPGFEPSSSEQWFSGDFSSGCARKSSTCADTFFSFKLTGAGKPDNSFDAQSEQDCKDGCANSCECRAYSYEIVLQRGRPSNRTCWVWTEDLNNLQEGELAEGPDMNVHVAMSDIESTAKNCVPCGTNLIPYPLSTSQSCGDPMYSSFECSNDTKKLSFNSTSGESFRVTSINPDMQTFTVLVDKCDSQDLGGIYNMSLPFFVKSGCKTSQNMSGSDMLLIYRVEVEIGWKSPPEPMCNSSNDCNGWSNSSCHASDDGNKRCLCNHNFIWNGTSVNCTQVEKGQSSPKKSPLIIGVAFGSVFLLLCAISTIIYYIHERIDAKRQEKRENIRRNQGIHLYDDEKHVKEFIESSGFTEEDKRDIDVPFFDMENILAATDSFSETNKLGQGGFGPVYKGMFKGGQAIAVKRLLSSSNQGLEQFKNEVVLIAKLQHRNLVRLLGYCVEGNEMILLYEYMPNKSLDFFIFDETRGMILDWKKRFDIIFGIARGLLYLHQDSRLKIIHRDLKTSNILLDEEMNPKISDFGLARIFESKQIDAATKTIVGTYGYMSPEYATEGFFSVKSDVFSFGVVVLEIISGRRNMGLYRSEQSLSLLGYAFKLWTEDKGLDMIDASLQGTFNVSEFLKCLNVGLLCVQEDPNDRPDMSNVLFMLGSENVMLSTPKPPAFVLSRGSSTTTSTNYQEITTTLQVGR